MSRYDLFEQVMYRLPDINRFGLHELEEVATIDPKAGIRLLRFILDRSLNQYLIKRAQEQEELGENYAYSFNMATLYNELQSLENSELEKVFVATSQVEPQQFLEAMLPWLGKALQSRETTDNVTKDYYLWDDFSGNWYDNIFQVQNAFVFGLIRALIQLSESSQEQFRAYTNHLAELPYRTPQLILTHVYRALPETYATDALIFLISDPRRLDLGYVEQYDSRQVIKAIFPCLSPEQRLELEDQILAYAPIHKNRGVEGLRWRGIEQLNLLRSIPVELLSTRSLKRLREWERKFPNFIVSDDPKTTRGGFVGSPIATEIARKMSERNWLRAINKYKGPVEHRDFLKGGAEQLARVLEGLIKEDPGRYISLIQKILEDTEDVYIRSIINGLAESSGPAEWLYNVIRRFASQSDRNIKRVVAWSLKKRAEENMPDDLVDLLFSYLHADQGEDEWWWSKGENHGDIFSSFINSDRGSAFDALMRILDLQREDETLVRKWDLIEFVISDTSTALHIGAIEKLIYMIKYDRSCAISLFEQLIEGHEILLETREACDFVYWALYKNYLRLQPHILSIMHQVDEKIQEQGAQLACIAAISTEAMETDTALIAAQELAEKAITGSLPWRRGAARVYSHNISGKPKDICLDKIMLLIQEDDEQIQNEIGNIFFTLKGEHFFSLQGFIESYAKYSKKSNHQFSEYLFHHGLLDPEWAIFVIRLILNNNYMFEQAPWSTGVEELIRLVLRIYTYPAIDSGIQNAAMDIFDEFMERYSGSAHKVLSEWDQR